MSPYMRTRHLERCGLILLLMGAGTASCVLSTCNPCGRPYNPLAVPRGVRMCPRCLAARVEAAKTKTERAS